MQHDTKKYVPFIVTDTKGMPPKEAARKWHESINVLFESRLHDANGDGAYSRVEACMLGPLALGRAKFGPQYFDRSATKIGRDGLDHLLIQFYIEGNCRERNNKTANPTQPGDLWITDLSQPLATEVNYATNISLVIPRHLLTPLLSETEIHHQRVIKGGLPLAQLLRSHMQILLKTADQMTITDAAIITKPTLELVAATLNGTVEDINRNGVVTTIKLEIIRFMERNLADPNLTPPRIAEHFKISLRKLHYLFEIEGGVTNFIQRTRLKSCKRELMNGTTQSSTIGAVAEKFGFFNPQSFSRSFNREFGLSPRCIRAMAKQREAASDHGPNWNQTTWQEWIRLMR